MVPLRSLGMVCMLLPLPPAAVTYAIWIERNYIDMDKVSKVQTKCSVKFQHDLKVRLLKIHRRRLMQKDTEFLQMINACRLPCYMIFLGRNLLYDFL